MSNDNPDYLHLASHKFSITCKTCGITETFYSETSVGYFRLKHDGHELVEGARSSPPPPVPPQPVQVAPSKSPPMEVETRDAPKQVGAPAEENIPVVKLQKVLVDTRVSARDGFPVIRVRGMNGIELLFVRLFKPEEAGKMREFLGSGRYEDRDADNAIYTWDTDVVSFQEEPGETRVPVEPRKSEVQVREPVPAVDSVFPSMEKLPAETAPARIQEPPRVPERPPLRTEKPSPPHIQEPPRMVEPSPPRIEKPKRVEKQPAVEKQPVNAAPPVLQAPIPAEKAKKAKKDHETLLLAKSSYIQEGEESMSEALRISKILKAFRWNVEPVYTIGVIVDDNLSIETNKGEISGALVKQIEKAGYKLSAVTASSGKPTAWFKRKPSPDVPLVDDPERTRQLEEKVEELSKTLQDERSGASEQKATWEKRFLLLTNLVRSMRQGGPESGAEPDDSEPQPEADVTS